MDTNQYILILKALENSHKSLLCSYCGCETASMGKSCICSNCESFVDSTRASLQMKNNVLLDMLDSINNHVKDSHYDDAIAVYDKLLSLNKDPCLMYAEALLFMQYSNHELAKISYDRSGFMEENAQHRDKSAKLLSSSKRLLAKGISTVEAEALKGNGSPVQTYSLFLCHMKLENYRGAQKDMQELESKGSKYLASYASMIFNVGIGKYESAIKDAESLLDNKNFSVNALFYIALSKFRKGNANDAKRILAALSSISSSEAIISMIKEIEDRGSI